MQPLKVAMLGCGVVGSEVAARLQSRAEALEERIGAPLELTAVVVRDATKERPGIDPNLLTTDAEAAIKGADIVIELMGGIEPAKSLITSALAQGSSVVTANKALLAQDGASLYEAADVHGVDLSFEAAVAGAGCTRPNSLVHFSALPHSTSAALMTSPSRYGPRSSWASITCSTLRSCAGLSCGSRAKW